MPLEAQRFRDSATLTRCVDEGYRMRRGERDRDAVMRVQLALRHLGYREIQRVDGEWGPRTDDLVIAFKKDEKLRPSDAVASRGTIGQLDVYFAWEPDDPDYPEPTTDGLMDLATDTLAEAAGATEKATAVLTGLTWGGPPRSLEEEQVRSALLAHTGIDAGSPSYDADLHRVQLVARLTALHAVLSPVTTTISFDPKDRQQWHAMDGRSFYMPSWFEADGPRLVVTPPFRNAYSHVQRLVAIMNAGLRLVAPDTDPFGFPGTRRYSALTSEQRRNNWIGLASLILYCGAGISEYTRPPAVWGSLSSFD